MIDTSNIDTYNIDTYNIEKKIMQISESDTKLENKNPFELLREIFSNLSIDKNRILQMRIIGINLEAECNRVCYETGNDNEFSKLVTSILLKQNLSYIYNYLKEQ